MMLVETPLSRTSTENAIARFWKESDCYDDLIIDFYYKINIIHSDGMSGGVYCYLLDTDCCNGILSQLATTTTGISSLSTYERRYLLVVLSGLK
jgi:hypothetical protein